MNYNLAYFSNNLQEKDQQLYFSNAAENLNQNQNNLSGVNFQSINNSFDNRKQPAFKIGISQIKKQLLSKEII